MYEEIRAFTAKARIGDTILVYFSGHEITDTDTSKFYFLTNDSENFGCNRDSIATWTAVESEFVTSNIEKSRATAKVIILDCCYSGALRSPDKAVDGFSESLRRHSSRLRASPY